MQQSALYPIHQALGAEFTEAAGWTMPAHFGHVDEEYEAVRQTVGVMDLSHRSLVRITGSHRQRFLQAMVSNDTADLEPGQGCHAALLTNRGRLVADFVVYADADAYWLDLEPGLAPNLISALDFFIIADDVEMTDVTAEWGLLSLQGPDAAELTHAGVRPGIAVFAALFPHHLSPGRPGRAPHGAQPYRRRRLSTAGADGGAAGFVGGAVGTSPRL